MLGLRSALILLLINLHLGSIDQSAAFSVKRLESEMENMAKNMEKFQKVDNVDTIQSEFKKFAKHVKEETKEALQVINVWNNTKDVIIMINAGNK